MRFGCLTTNYHRRGLLLTVKNTLITHIHYDLNLFSSKSGKWGRRNKALSARAISKKLRAVRNPTPTERLRDIYLSSDVLRWQTWKTSFMHSRCLIGTEIFGCLFSRRRNILVLTHCACPVLNSFERSS